MTKKEFLSANLPYRLKCKTKLSDGVRDIIAGSFGKHVLFQSSSDRWTKKLPNSYHLKNCLSAFKCGMCAARFREDNKSVIFKKVE